jgi:hypothetical protein
MKKMDRKFARIARKTAPTQAEDEAFNTANTAEAESEAEVSEEEVGGV